MRTQNLILEERICDFCNPDHDQQLSKRVAHLLTKDGNWIGGWTAEKSDEWQKIRIEFERDLRKLCFNIDQETGKYICGQHLVELAARMFFE